MPTKQLHAKPPSLQMDRTTRKILLDGLVFAVILAAIAMLVWMMPERAGLLGP